MKSALLQGGLLGLLIHMLGFGLHQEEKRFNEPCGLVKIFFPAPLHFPAENDRKLLRVINDPLEGEIAAPCQLYFAF